MGFMIPRGWPYIWFALSLSTPPISSSCLAPPLPPMSLHPFRGGGEALCEAGLYLHRRVRSALQTLTASPVCCRHIIVICRASERLSLGLHDAFGTGLPREIMPPTRPGPHRGLTHKTLAIGPIHTCRFLRQGVPARPRIAPWRSADLQQRRPPQARGGALRGGQARARVKGAPGGGEGVGVEGWEKEGCEG